MGLLPTFCTPEEMAFELEHKKLPLPAERLIELANLNYLPAHTIDGKGPFFIRQEVREWVAEKLIVRNEPRPFPRQLVVPLSKCAVPIESPIPPELDRMKDHLYELPLDNELRSACVYFLLRENRVVYVGQSVALATRIGSHCGTKIFDRVLFLPVPENDLDELEASFIRVLAPELNQKLKRTATDEDLDLITARFGTLGTAEVEVG